MHKIPTVEMKSGLGDTVGGLVVHGNTPHPIANAQRDGQPQEYRQSFGKRLFQSNSKLESRKRNKGV